MFCTNCGMELAEGAAFCTQCGAPVAAPSAPSQADEQVAVATGETAEVAPEAEPVPEREPAPEPVPEPAAAPSPEAEPVPEPAAETKPVPTAVPEPAPEPAAAPEPAPAPAPEAEPTAAPEPAPAPAPEAEPTAAPEPQPMPAPDLFSQPPQKKGGAGKTVGIVAGVVALLAVLCVGGYFVYQAFFATGPEEVIMQDLDAHLAEYSDPSSGDGDRLMAEADSVLSGLAAYPFPGDDAYSAWLEDTSYTVDEVTVSDDGNSAVATATITHAPLISFVEHHEGLADDPGDPQETTLELTYVRDGSAWTADGNDLQDAVFDAYLPSDEELIISDVHSYFESSDDMYESFATGLESGAGAELEQLGISAEEFADTYLDGYSYEVGAVTVSDDSATVDVAVTIKSYTEIMAQFEDDFTAWTETVDPSTLTSEEQVYQKAGEILIGTCKAAEPKSYDVELSFTQDSGGVWWLDADSEYELMNILGM